jgi:hypothetical protein
VLCLGATSVEWLLPQEKATAKTLFEGCTYSGSALQNKVFVASSLFADHCPHPAHNQDKRVKMSGI